MDIQNIVIANHHINLVRALKDYHIRHYIWEVAKVLIPVFITSLITVIVMRSNENRNKKRWLNESFVKHQNDLIIKVNAILIDFYNKFDKHFIYKTKSIDVKLINSFFEQYESDFEELRDSYYHLLEMYKIKNTPLINTLSQLDFIKNYARQNIESNPGKSTILLTGIDEGIELETYLSEIASELSQSKEAMIKVVQKKLK